MKVSFGKLLLFIALLAGVGLAVSSNRVSAASNGQILTINPSATNEIVQPGSINSGIVTVKNQGSNGYNFSVYATPYSVLGEAYTPNFSARSSITNITNWFHIAVTSGYLNPGSSVAVSYTLIVPKDVAAGGYYAAIFAQTHAPSLGHAESGFQVSQRVGELFYLQVPGPVVQKGRVASWQASFLQSSPATGILRLENDGGIHYIASVSVSFRDILGSTKYNYTALYVVLPHTIRRIIVVWPHPPAFGLFKVNGTAITYGTQQLTTKYILVVSNPMRVVVIVIIALLILAVILKSMLRDMKKSKKPAISDKTKGKSGDDI